MQRTPTVSTRTRAALTSAASITAMISLTLTSALPGAHAAARENTPKQAMDAIAACAAETYNPSAADQGQEQHRVWNACQYIVPDDAGLWSTPDLARYLRAEIDSAGAEQPEWVACQPGSVNGAPAYPWEGAKCAAHFGLSYQNKHFEFATWVDGDHRSYYWTLEQMTSPDGRLNAVGEKYWRASPWVDCSGSPAICRLVLTPREPA